MATILVAYDGSVPAQEALEYAARTYPEERLVLLRVIEAASGSTEAGINLIQESLRDREEAMAAKLDEEIPSVIDLDELDLEMEIVIGKPAREIVRWAEEHGIDHIVIGNHGRSGVSRVLLGSVAEKVVRRAPVPVTVVR